MALPSFRALGTFASGTTSCTPGLPTGHATDDILVLIVECAFGETPNTPSGYTSLGSANDGTDVKLTVFIKRDNGSESAPTVNGTSNHIHAWIAAYSGVQNTGSPWLLGSFTTQATATVTYAGITTGFADALVLLLTAIGDNANDVENLSGYTNANLSSLTDRDDEAETTGTGGGLGFADGGKASAGATGDSTCTHDNAVGSVSVHLALYSTTSASTTLTADAAAFDVTGVAETSKIGVPVAEAAYAWTGDAETTDITAAVAEAAFAVVGSDATIDVPLIFAADAASYSWAGAVSDVDLGIAVGTGTFAIAGDAAGADITVPVATAAYTIVGDAVACLQNVLSVAADFAISGAAADFPLSGGGPPIVVVCESALYVFMADDAEFVLPLVLPQPQFRYIAPHYRRMSVRGQRGMLKRRVRI